MKTEVLSFESGVLSFNTLVTLHHSLITHHPSLTDMNKLTKTHKYLLSTLSGVLLTLSWLENGLPFLILFAFVPLFIIEYNHFLKKDENHSFDVVKYAAIAFAIWNTITTFWIKNAAWVGLIAAVVVNTLFMSLAFWLFHIYHRKNVQGGAAYLSFIAFVLSFEFLGLRWELNWPWLNLGNVFANYPSWIQWYEYTGVSGGSLWILLINIFIFFILKNILLKDEKSKRSLWANSIALALVFIVPFTISQIRFHTYEEEINPVNVIVVQPNLDPYTEQYEIEPTVVTSNMLALAQRYVSDSTDVIAFPESAIQEYTYENSLAYAPSIQMIGEFLQQSEREMYVIAGMSTKKNYGADEKPSKTARKYSNADIYYDSYNTALLIDKELNFQLHHKSKLTPGVEIMPFAKQLKFLEKYILDFGGIVGSLGVDKVQKPLIANDNIKVASIICYESVFGEFCTEFVRNGANLFCVITNDGWWGDTPGYKQHFSMSRIRAIECRRSVARSANTGISGFINQKGEVLHKTDYWVADSAAATLNLNNKITFYAKYGDYIQRISLLIAALSTLILITQGLLNKKRTTK